ncbi:DUF3574 domain-containing protein [Gluconobacter thailandicus]|uniref:DUF3574 domain-containing protein n=1 Tax=Gluconobacter thailandicus TaxID=257438 RepID=UPI001F276127|nr:DUF3574 domain-containing protein [Gluconobacter thailandicus]
MSVTPDLCREMRAQDTLQIRMMFGQTRPGGLPITDSEWQDFMTKEITPRFPSGLTVFNADGQWMNTVTHIVGREPSRILWVVVPADKNLQHNLRAIQAAYRQQFSQQAVGLTIQSGCSLFN